MNCQQVARRKEETGQQTGVRYRAAGALWIVAVIFFVISEGVIVFAQLHRGGHGLRSLEFWYVPIMNSSPLVSAVEIYRRMVRKASSPSEREALPKWSFNIAYLTCVAISTTLICYVDLLTGGL